MPRPRKKTLIRYAGYDPMENRFFGPRPDIDAARALELKMQNPDWTWKVIGEKLAEEAEAMVAYKADAVAGAVFRYKKNQKVLTSDVKAPNQTF